MLNRVMFIGYAGRDAEVRYMPSGEAVANFSVASTEKWKDKQGEPMERTEWLRCTAWGKLGEICGEWVKKGQLVYVEGKLQTRKWTDKDGTEKYSTEATINVMRLLGGKGDGKSTDRDYGESREREQARAERPAATPTKSPVGRPAPFDRGFADMDDDIPF